MLIAKLPDCYAKNATSNNYKLLQLSEEKITELRENISEVALATDIAHSSGGTLDLFGEMLGKKRGNLDDSKYRYLLSTQIAQNTINGDFNNILTSIVEAFSLTQGDVSYNDIKITESTTSGNIEVVKLPLKILNKAGFTIAQALSLIRDILPIGVGLNSAIIEGTFEFAQNEGTYDAEKGFGSTSNPNIGGMLGALIG